MLSATFFTSRVDAYDAVALEKVQKFFTTFQLFYLLAMGRTSTARSRLLETANKLIWEKSFHSVSVDDICHAAGVRKGSFYHFFPSKVDLAVAACEYRWETDWKFLTGILESPGSALERFENFCDAVIQIQMNHYHATGKIIGCPYGSLGYEVSTGEERLRTCLERVNTQLGTFYAALVADSMKEGSLPAGDPLAHGKVIQCCIVGFLLQATVRNDPSLLKEMKRSAMGLMGRKSLVAA